MDKSNLRKRFSAVALSAALALAVCVPATAFADAPDVSNEPDSGQAAGTTKLTLKTTQDLTPTNSASAAGETGNFKVVVPAKINYVADLNSGTITGPASATITNYTKNAIHVETISLAAETGIHFVSSPSASGDINLSVRPMDEYADAVNFSSLAATNGYTPAGTDHNWEIDAATYNGDTLSSAGTLTLFLGNGTCATSMPFNTGTSTAIGTITWTIAVGANS